MRKFDNPALCAFIGQLGEEMILAQVLIRCSETGWELRNAADRDKATTDLRDVPVESLRELVQFDAARAFRPLKSAPDLVGGWRCVAADEESLGDAVNRIYPGAVADWFAAQQSPTPVTGYREFTERQSGMYRITTMLDDAQAGLVIRAACHREFCLKQRRWSVQGLPADSVEEKSLLPCLEPCAVLLEFARKCARIEQEEKVAITLSATELADVKSAMEPAHNPATARSTDEQRRRQLIREKLVLASGSLKPRENP